MNWTEGNLSRHIRSRGAGGGNETVLRQKQHFAKARSGLFGGHKSSPLSISFLTHASSPLSRHASQSLHSAAIPLSSPSSKKRPRQPDAPNSSRYFQDVDLQLPQPPRYQQQNEEEEIIRQKSRRLLLKGDWVGTAMQKPIQMNFSQPRKSPSNPWGISRSRHHSSKHRLRHLLGFKHEVAGSRLDDQLLAKAPPTRQEDMRVRVGSCERALGESSNMSVRSSSYRRARRSSYGESREAVRYYSRKRHPIQEVTDENSSSDQQHILMSSPLVFQPVPRRLVVPRILRSRSRSINSENADSMVVQVRPHQLPVPLSQVEENEAWNKWVGSSEISHSSTGQMTSNARVQVERAISPGISHPGQAEGVLDPSNEETTTHAPCFEDMIGTDSTANNSPDQQLPEQVFSEEPEDADIEDTAAYEDEGFDAATPTSTSNVPIAPQLDYSSDSDETVLRENEMINLDRTSDISLLVMDTSPRPSSLTTHDVPRTPRPRSRSTSLPTQSVDDTPNSPPTRFSPTQAPGSPESPHKPYRATEAESDLDEQATPAVRESMKAVSPVILNENELWRQFVQSESDDDMNGAFEEARKETARMLKPSETFVSTSDNVEPTATGSSHRIGQEVVLWDSAPGVDSNGFSEPTDRSWLRTSVTETTETCASNVATEGTSCLSFATSDTPAESPETPTYTDQATLTPSDASHLAEGNLEYSETNSRPSSESVTYGSDTNSLAVQPAKSQVLEDAEDSFKFARPKLFVGKNSGTGEAKGTTPRGVLWVTQIKSRVRGMARKPLARPRARDGRTDIRQLPDFDGDPIEEIEEDLKSTRAEKSSLFGSLETEQGTY